MYVHICGSSTTVSKEDCNFLRSLFLGYRNKPRVRFGIYYFRIVILHSLRRSTAATSYDVKYGILWIKFRQVPRKVVPDMYTRRHMCMHVRTFILNAHIHVFDTSSRP